MANCIHCGQPISGNERFRGHCGAPAYVPGPLGESPLQGTDANGGSSTVTVLGYRESFAAHPAVKIFIDGRQVGEVQANGKTAIPVAGPCTLVFKCAFRSAKCQVNGGDWVVLAFNRATGSLGATVTDEQNSRNVVVQNLQKDNKRWLWTVVAIAVLALLGMLLRS